MAVETLMAIISLSLNIPLLSWLIAGIIRNKDKSQYRRGLKLLITGKYEPPKRKEAD